MKNTKDLPPDMPELYRKLHRLSRKMNLVERASFDFGLPESLLLSEVHTLQAIGSTPDNNVGIIAATTGVTPSAASQVITKLAKRGLVEKLRGVRNEKEVLLRLTPKGLVVYHNHEKIHAVECDRIYQAIGSLSVGERTALDRVFSALEAYYDKRFREEPLTSVNTPGSGKH
jgi:DNA-binding MarR family transcriptional regulator